MGEIKVAIADDHKIFRKGLIVSLRHYSQFKFVLEAENGQELLDGLDEAKPDVILMDLRMPVKDGIETTKYISEKYPDIRIVVLTMHEDEKFVLHLMENGANGYLLKSTDPVEIKKAITEIFLLCKNLGGTISGEHGIGLIQQEYINIVFSEKTIAIQKQIKQVFDPKNILNPGKIFA